MQTPEQLTDHLKTILEPDLKAVVLYGSAAAGDRTARYSDYNILIVVKDPSLVVLRSVMPLLKRWRRDGNRAPLFFSESRFHQAADVFPIEFSDMKRHHKVLFGPADLFAAVEIDKADLRHQLEFELRSKLITLRQSFLDADGRASAVRPLLAHALSAFAALFRTVLELQGEAVPAHKPEVWRAVAKHALVDVEALDTIWKMREGDREAGRADPDELFSRLVSTVEGVTDFVDRQSGLGSAQGRTR